MHGSELGVQGFKLRWEFPKIRGTLFGRSYDKDPTISSTVLGSPIFGNSHAHYLVEQRIASIRHE